MINFEYFLETEINRKLAELKESETQRKIVMAIADEKLKTLSTDLDILQKCLAAIKEE